MDWLFEPYFDELINALKEQNHFKNMNGSIRRKKISRISHSLKKQMLSEYETGKALWDVLEAMIVSLNSKFKLEIPVNMFSWMKEDVEDAHTDGNDEDTDDSEDSFIAEIDPVPSVSADENDVTHSDQKVAAQDEESTQKESEGKEKERSEKAKESKEKEKESNEKEKENNGKEKVSNAWKRKQDYCSYQCERNSAAVQERYFERSRDLYLSQTTIEEAEKVKRKLYLKDRTSSGLLSREILEQSEAFVNARARGIAAIATLDRRLLSNNELLKYGVTFICDSELNAEDSTKINSGQRALIFKSSYKGLPVTVKSLRAPNLCRISQEYLLFQLLSSHPTIQHAFGVQGNSFATALVLSHVDGDTLCRCSFEDSIALGVFVVKLMEGLAHVHRQGVLHNNLKASHILKKRGECVPIITGFGNACMANDAYKIPQSRLKEFGDICLHKKDVREGKKAVSYLSDIYCLGQLLSQIRAPDDTDKSQEKVSKWVREFASTCRSTSCSSLSSADFLQDNAADLIRLIGSIRPELLDW